MSAHPLRFKQPNRKQVARGLATMAAGLDNHAEHLQQQQQINADLSARLTAADDNVAGIEQQADALAGRVDAVWNELTARIARLDERKLPNPDTATLWGRLRWLFTGK